MKEWVRFVLCLVLIVVSMCASAVAMKDTQRGRASGIDSENDLPDQVFPPRSSLEGQIYVQLGAFRRLEGATRLSDEIERLDNRVSILRGVDFQRVVVGPFVSKQEANRTLRALQQHGYQGYLRRDLFPEAPSVTASSHRARVQARAGSPIRVQPDLALSRGSPADIHVPPRDGLVLVPEQLLPTDLSSFPSTSDAMDGFGDAARGAQLLHDRHCTTCHTLGTKRWGSAPDLSRRSRHVFSPAALAAMLWNHGPAVWQSARRQHFDIEPFTEQEMRDLYCYFYALRYFDPPGDAARGKRLFTTKHCDRCHDVRVTASRPGPPVPLWKSLGDPSLWAQEMTNHGTEAAAQMRQMQLVWGELSLQEMVDLLVYFENLPGLGRQARTFAVGDPSVGEQLFEERGCSSCHTIGKRDHVKIDLLSRNRRPPRRPWPVRIIQWLRPRPPQHRSRDRSLSTLAVAMWNHSPLLDSASRDRALALLSFQPNEMAGLLAFLIQKGYFRPPGRAVRGRKIFRKKGCNQCHAPAGSLALRASRIDIELSEVHLAAAPWNHKPPWLGHTKGARSWPAMTDRDVIDLVAYSER